VFAASVMFGKTVNFKEYLEELLSKAFKEVKEVSNKINIRKYY
jgi:hypothetical protein